ncbi:hypothetical protein HDU76_006016 [Blyttiomyces sp. JEL0837]|nr:hypothetical protein HDU76_006016 [Blyttiomyces sp. JEL0837]
MVACSYESIQRTEDKALHPMKGFLYSNDHSELVELPRVITDIFRKPVETWDGMIYSPRDRTVYLLEAKYAMDEEKLRSIAERVQKFTSTASEGTSHSGYLKVISKIIGVACPENFSSKELSIGKDLGLYCIYPSGGRYIVAKSEEGICKQ